MSNCLNCGKSIRHKLEPEGYFCTQKCGYIYAVYGLRRMETKSKIRQAEKILKSKTRH